jgi:hypothetical protein
MASEGSLKRLGGGRWETRDGRFAIEPQSGTWVIVDNEQTDELGLPLVRGPFGSLTAAKAAIEAARTEGPKASPLADRIDRAGEAEKAGPKASKAEPEAPPRRSAAAREADGAKPAPKPSNATQPEPEAPPEPSNAEAPLEPRWLRDLEAADQRRARDLIARLERMGVADPQRIVRAEVAEGQPALAQLAVERAVAKARAGKESSGAVRAVVSAMLRGADVELGVSWKLVDDDGRRIERVELPD